MVDQNDHLELKNKFKVWCIFPIVVASILPHAKIGPNDHRVDALHFIYSDRINDTENLVTSNFTSERGKLVWDRPGFRFCLVIKPQ